MKLPGEPWEFFYCVMQNQGIEVLCWTCPVHDRAFRWVKVGQVPVKARPKSLYPGHGLDMAGLWVGKGGASPGQSQSQSIARVKLPHRIFARLPSALHTDGTCFRHTTPPIAHHRTPIHSVPTVQLPPR